LPEKYFLIDWNCQFLYKCQFLYRDVLVNRICVSPTAQRPVCGRAVFFRIIRRSVLRASLSIVFLAAAIPRSDGSTVYLDVDAGTEIVGHISVTDDSQIEGIVGQFDAKAGTSLAQAAATLGVDHFNWYQVVVWDPAPPPGGGGSVTTVPYVDPPPGGYDGQWGDRLPWYWDEYSLPGVQYDPTFQVSYNTKPDWLVFNDVPDMSGGSFDPGAMLDFGIWLVGVDQYGTFISFYGGFSWEATYDGVDTHYALTGELTAPPPDALYQNIIGGFLTASPIPEPAAILLIMFGLALLPRRRRASYIVAGKKAGQSPVSNGCFSLRLRMG
jgi:hypothetical protein